MTIKSILRALGCCIVALMVLEVCARVDDYVSFGASFWGPYNSETLYHMDTLGKHGKPNARYKKWQLNSLGYRGPEPQTGKETIVCFGSSETFGLYESPGKEYPRQLESEIRGKIGGNFQVINVAFPGETISTAEKRVPAIIKDLHPSYAFVYPSPATYIWLPWIMTSKEARANPIKQPLFEWRIADNTRVILKELIPDGVQTRIRQLEIDHAAEEFPVLDRVPTENIELFTRDLESLVKEIRRRGVEPILVTHATYFGVALSGHDKDMLVAWRKFYPMLKEEGFPDMETRANDAIMRIAERQRITIVDAAVKIRPGREHFADFVHFTDQGAHEMAVRLAEGLMLTRMNQVRPAHLQSAGVGETAERK